MGGYPKTDITVERLGVLTESMGREIGRLLRGEAVPLFHDTFMSGGAAHAICVVEQAEE
jgi:hypothetical protein